MRSLLFVLTLTSVAIAGDPPPRKVETKDIEVGKGKLVADGDEVETTLSATLDDGKKISVQSPYKFVLGRGQAIRGYDDGVHGMRQGGRRMIAVPSAYAYNDGRNFIFDVQLVSVTTPK